jgi:hypothetical protein
MPQSVKTDVIEASRRPERSPWFLDVDQMASATFADDHKRVAFDLWRFGQYTQCWPRQMKNLRSGL